MMKKPDLLLKETAPLFEGIRKLEKQRVPKNIFICLILFAASIVFNVLLQNIVGFAAAFIRNVTGVHLPDDPDIELAVMLFSTFFTIVSTLVFTRLIENRPNYTALIRKKKCLHDYFCGALIGFGMMGVVVLAAWAGGALHFDGASLPKKPAVMLLLIAGWMIQGFSEEIMCRGYLMMSVGTHHKVWTAIIVNAIMFALLHLGNEGFSAFAVINLILYGIAMSLYMLRTGSIWGAAALHSAWNWAQGNFFGMQVSGIETNMTVLRFSQTGAADWLGGKQFGLEAGAATTVVLMIVIGILLYMPQRKPEDV